MNNTLRYKGYVARVDLDADNMVFTGRLLGMAEPIEFHGASIEELVADFHFAVDHYLAECEKSGQAPEKPASGKLLLRLPPETHAQASVAAAALGLSLVGTSGCHANHRQRAEAKEKVVNAASDKVESNERVKRRRERSGFAIEIPYNQVISSRHA